MAELIGRNFVLVMFLDHLLQGLVVVLLLRLQFLDSAGLVIHLCHVMLSPESLVLSSKEGFLSGLMTFEYIFAIAGC